MRLRELAAETGGFYARVLVGDVCYAIVFPSHCLLWRGAWNNTARYVFPDPTTGGWFCYVTGLCALTVLQHISYAGAMGCAVDGASQKNESLFPAHVLRYYFLESKEEEKDDKNDDLNEVTI